MDRGAWGTTPHGVAESDRTEWFYFIFTFLPPVAEIVTQWIEGVYMPQARSWSSTPPWSARTWLQSLLPGVCAQLLSHISLFATAWTTTARLLCPWDFQGKSTRVGCHFKTWCEAGSLTTGKLAEGHAPQYPFDKLSQGLKLEYGLGQACRRSGE